MYSMASFLSSNSFNNHHKHEERKKKGKNELLLSLWVGGCVSCFLLSLNKSGCRRMFLCWSWLFPEWWVRITCKIHRKKKRSCHISPP
jgi:hypothetical protein